jgi:hypothetical protein
MNAFLDCEGEDANEGNTTELSGPCTASVVYRAVGGAPDGGALP